MRKDTIDFLNIDSYLEHTTQFFLYKYLLSHFLTGSSNNLSAI